MLTYLVVILWLLAAILVIAACANQRKLWWKTRAWRYRDPQASEPTGAALVAGRIAKLVAAAILVAGTFLVNGPARAALSANEQRDVWIVALQAAVSLDSRPLEITDMAFRLRVHKAISDVVGNQAKLTEGDQFSNGGRTGLKFEIADADGGHPVCLTVFADRLPESTAQRAVIATSTSLAKGRC